MGTCESEFRCGVMRSVTTSILPTPVLTPHHSEIQDLTIASVAAHKLKPSLSIRIASKILNLPGLELVHYLYNIELLQN